MLFPYDKIRPVQQEFITDVEKVLADRKNLLVHAPTGIGKTAAVLAPALSYSLKGEKKIFFLTARHTQHEIALKTLKDIQEKHGISVICADLISKQHMCLQPNVTNLSSSEFREYCKAVVKEKQCEFYEKTRLKGKPSPEAMGLIGSLKTSGPHSVESLFKESERCKLCPYEVASMLASKAHVIIADYFYLLNPKIRESFLQKIGTTLSDCIIVMDEGHNISSRCRDLLTHKMSSVMIERALSEADKYEYEMGEIIGSFISFFEQQELKLSDYQSEGIVLKKELVSFVQKQGIDYMQLVTDLLFAGDEVREQQKYSYLGSLGSFLEAWMGSDDGFTRIFSAEKSDRGTFYSLMYRSLDPSLLTTELISGSHSTIVMSGTLTPTPLFKDVLGVPDCVEREFDSPFPKDNRMNLIIPQTTTKYARRTAEEFSRMGEILVRVIEKVPGNTAVFFPSYAVRDQVYPHVEKCSKTVFREEPGLSKSEKLDFLQRFYAYKDSGAVLMGVSTGSFGEGVDFPGDLLRCVVIVGLPLEKPNLETKESIQYYEDKFGRGWDYGYIYPAITKTMQNAGRCIRSETDRGAIIFLDERYAWDNYRKCFPHDWEMKITDTYEEDLGTFYSGEKKQEYSTDFVTFED